MYKKELTELRRRFIYCIISIILASAVAFHYYNFILAFILKPLTVIPHTLIATAVFEGFTIKFTIALLTGTLISLPLFLYHFLRFIMPAMTKKEKTGILIAIGASILLGLCGFVLTYRVLPLAIQCVLNQHFIPNEVRIMLNYQQTVMLICKIIIGGTLIFELPLILWILIYFNLLPLNFLIKYARHIIVVIFIIAAIITPPDAVSQLFVAVPLCLIFSLTIIIAKILNR